MQGAQPLPYEVVDGVKTFRLEAEQILWETKEGKLVEAWAYDRQIPGPTIRVKDGERVRLVVTNRLSEGTTTHWHGVEVPNGMDGVPGISQDPIRIGDSSHFNSLHQEEHGLYGMFVVEPKTEAPQLKADKEQVMIVGDGPLGFVINGKEFPMVAPIRIKKGEKVRVRWANLGGMYHPMHLHGGHFTIVAKDGFDLPSPQKANTLSLAPGETYDVILAGDEPGTWLWHCHVLSHVTGPRDETGAPTVAGMVGIVQVDDGRTALIPPTEHKHH